MSKTSVSKEIETIPVSLSKQELADMAQEMAQKVGQLENIEVEKKKTASEYKTQIDDLIEEIRYLAQCLTRKIEMRDVEIVTTTDYEAGTVTRTNSDTGEILSERQLNPGEKQMGLEVIK